MFSKTDLLDQIEKGLYQSWLMAFDTNDTPYVSMKPEYLTTVLLGRQLSDWLKTDQSNERYLVRFEERTKDVATRAFAPLPLPYTPRNVHGRAKKDTGEEGAVDLVIYKQVSFFPETVAVFEIKNFDQPDGLLEKDIARNIEFMELADPKKANQIQYGVLTFFLHDKHSVTKEQASNFLSEKTAYFAQMIGQYSNPRISASLTLKTLTNAPTLTHAEAAIEDEEGRPLIESEENHHIAYGVVLLERI